MSVQIVEGTALGLTDAQANALEILAHLDVGRLNRLKELMELDVPGVIGPMTVRTFAALCADEGFDLSEAGVNQFKVSRHLGNTGVLAGLIGPQTALTYHDELLLALATVEEADAAEGARAVGINAEGLALVKEFEGLHRKIGNRPGFVESYLDPVNIWTIGYGHTNGVRPGDVIRVVRAEELLREDLAEFEKAVRNLITVSLSSNEFAALVAFSFNVGAGALKKSTLRRKLNQGDRQSAANEFPRWNRGGGMVLPGLTRRRKAERALFLTP